MLGVEQCGGGKWADIKKLGYDVIAARSAVDLKDKWRNLMRVAILPHIATRCVPARRFFASCSGQCSKAAQIHLDCVVGRHS